MTDILLIASITLLLIAIVVIWFRNPQKSALADLQARIATLQNTVNKLESGLKEDFRINRIESADLAKANRQELNETLHGFKAEQSQTLATITTQNRQALIDINQTLDDKVKTLTTTLDNNNNLNRESLLNAFKTFQENFDAHIKTFNEVQRDKFSQMLTSQQTLIANTETKLENIRTTVEEKLEKTLSERLGQSFETVGKQLIEVQKGLGEMQTIATDVGGLKKVLSNVKLRGGVGEVQLALLLEQILAPSQYEANVKTKKGSSEPVEFAIKLPGRSDDENAFVYLPIDAKFPKDTYEHLLSAYETANPEEIEVATKNLETTIKKMAKDIRDKYLDPPNTTDFAILFLPFESIYAEVIRRTALIDQLRTEFKITVAGPTTLMAILNSLQMGFRTLALQKRSSEVWQVLATVKKEFENFGGLLEKAQKNIQTGLGQLDDVVGTRTRAINRQLKHVESLPVVNVREEMTESSEPLTDGTED
ncbi:MAG: DNA recombination protein RmuC [Chitinophagaceae bacterium]